MMHQNDLDQMVLNLYQMMVYQLQQFLMFDYDQIVVLINSKIKFLKNFISKKKKEEEFIYF
jgi:hypothetical protein